jgi:tight adherence protein C
MQIIFYFAASFTLFCTIILLCLPLLFKAPPETERMLLIVQSSRKDQRKIPYGEWLVQKLLTSASALRSRVGKTEDRQIKQRLNEAGLRGARASDSFFAAQAVGVISGGVLGSLIPVNTVFWILSGAAVGFMLPGIWLAAQARKRRARIRRSIPDAIDLLVICVDAGLGLDQALLRVGEELDMVHPEINEEFTRINLEQRAGTPRLDAWKGLAERTKIEEFTAFVTMLTQTDRFGTPIIKALSSFSEEIRTKRRQHAEEAAAKTKIKIIFPLVLCIFPCIFIVLLVPALLGIVKGMKVLGN